MTAPLLRASILPEAELPEADGLIAEGARLAGSVGVGDCPFLSEHGVPSEIAYKERRMAAGAIMFHAQVGYRDPAKSRRAYGEIHERLAAAGHGVDRYGICLDWSMGYPAARRGGMGRGTGLILEEPEDFAALTRMAPVAPHFGDFVIGTPAALDNTAAALAAGSTAIGNLGQYFTFRLPHWDDDVTTTAETVKALALAAAQPVDILIHSNLDDGFAALFCDLACALGAVLIEQYIIEDLIGGCIGHCFGHTYSDPLSRIAFQRALVEVSNGPGTMVYGNTTSFTADHAANYASLAGYLMADVCAQRTRPSGHALNPVPVSEAERIPEIDEIVDAHLFANRLVEWTDKLLPHFDLEGAEEQGVRIVEGGRRFRDDVLAGLAEAGIDTGDPFEMLLAVKRIGARRLEELFGPGAEDASQPRGRTPVVQSSVVGELRADAARRLEGLGEVAARAIRAAGLTGCVASSDVHEYGKMLIESVLGALGVRVADGGVSVDPETLAERAGESGADFIALGTYNGVALDYLKRLLAEMDGRGLAVPVFIGGRLNQIPDDSNTSLPVDVGAELEAAGAVVCRDYRDLFEGLAGLAGGDNAKDDNP